MRDPRIICGALVPCLLISGVLTEAIASDTATPREAEPEPAVAPNPPGAGPRPVVAPSPRQQTKSVDELVAELDSPRYAEREAATKALIKIGGPAVEPLRQAVERGNLEVAVRAMHIVEAIYADVDREESATLAAESALEKWSRSEDASLAGRAEGILNRHVDIRRRRAIAAIERLGGKVVLGEQQAAPLADRGPPVERVHLGRNWKGGDDGLKYLSRLEPIGAVYVIKGSGISKQAVGKLKQSFRVAERGSACLGIEGAIRLQDGHGVQIRKVVPGGAAAGGGIQPGDIIVGFGGNEVGNFEDLIELIKEYEPGDKVNVEVRRPGPNGQPRKKTLTVVMDSWEDRH